MTSALHSPLHDAHVELGAKFAPFGGWDMPIEYSGGGVLAEHAAVREGVGVFDVSHLGKIAVRGPGAIDFLNRCLTNDLDRISDGQAQYTLCCAADGGVIDDLIVYRVSADEGFLIPNAANTREVARLLSQDAPKGVEVSDVHLDFAVIAVQGPRSADLLEQVGLPSKHSYMSFARCDWRGIALTVCRTGYTGELGFELVVPVHSARVVWDALFATDVPARACGLGARDTLRTEMGYPLHGQDLSPDITPVQARLGWAVGWSKPRFWGREALLTEKAAGPVRALRGLVATGRGIARSGMTVFNGEQSVGVITSGTFSPTRKTAIAWALLDPAVELDAVVLVDVRGRRADMRVVKPPFVEASPQK
ncbi:MAG: glycine cleavage system aminomethyltransferase GcvT [Corynebacteriales bacterium]|nr:glycine cleavage system aminomethyltransferase GcvT [Mycobacteriales bacterium]